MNKKSALTIIELVISMLVISVLAVMTIPSFNRYSKEKEYATGLKKAVSVVDNAIVRHYAINEAETLKNKTGFNFIDVLIENLNVVNRESYSSIYTADGMYFAAIDRADYSMPYTMTCNSNKDETLDNRCSVLIVDVNGQKGPNKFTESTNKVYDIFTMVVYPQHALPYTSTQQNIFMQK